MLFGHWAPSLQRLIAAYQDLPLVRPIHALPSGMTWPRVPEAMLLGDTA